MKPKVRILYLITTEVAPNLDSPTSPFRLLASAIEGDILHPIWYSSKEQVEEKYGPDSYPSIELESFRIHWILAGGSGRWKRFRKYIGFIRCGLAIYRERKYQSILCYGHTASALSGLLLKWLTGARLVVQFIVEPHNNYLVQDRHRKLSDYVLHVYNIFCVYISALCCDRILFIVPNMLKHFPLLRGLPASVCPDVPPDVSWDGLPEDEGYVLALGYPWYRKGYDILILAFRRISSQFPDIKLKIVGHNPDKKYLIELAAGCDQIEISDGVNHHRALELIRKCTVFAFPSRSEAMGRVLIEAMRYGKPCVGSDTGGIPYLIRDGQTGFVVPVEDPVALGEKLATLLSDPDLRASMGEEAKRVAAVEYTAERYVRDMDDAIRQSLVK